MATHYVVRIASVSAAALLVIAGLMKLLDFAVVPEQTPTLLTPKVIFLIAALEVAAGIYVLFAPSMAIPWLVGTTLYAAFAFYNLPKTSGACWEAPSFFYPPYSARP